MYRKWRLEFPKELTDEEKALRTKYEILKQLKEKAKVLHKLGKPNDSSEPLVTDEGTRSVQDDLKKTALQVLKTTRDSRKTSSVGKSTKDFKKPLRQSGEKDGGPKSSAKLEYTAEFEQQPRSVIVRGQSLTYELLQTAFSKCGDISHMRLDANNQSAVIQFTKSAHARLAVNNLNNAIIEGKQLGVELIKKPNTGWSEISAADAKFNRYGLQSREKRTIHVSYTGNLAMQDLKTVFRGIGRIEKMYLSSLNPASSSSETQYAFVTFERQEEATRALQEKDGAVFNGVALKVSPQKFVFSDSSIPVNASQEKDTRGIITFDDQM